MDIIASRQHARNQKINTIVNSIRKVLDAGQEIDKTKLILTASAELGLSRRTAKEYVEIAIFRLENDLGERINVQEEKE